MRRINDSQHCDVVSVYRRPMPLARESDSLGLTFQGPPSRVFQNRLRVWVGSNQLMSISNDRLIALANLISVISLAYGPDRAMLQRVQDHIVISCCT